MSCGRICKTTPCTFPACATDEQSASYAEGYDDAQFDARCDARIEAAGRIALCGPDETAQEAHARAVADYQLAKAAPVIGVAQSQEQRDQYADGFSDGYDAGLVAGVGKWDFVAMAVAALAIFGFGVLGGWLLL